MKMEDEELPRGYRFYPTEEELVSFYLQNKLQNTRQDIDCVIPLVDIYQYNPWDLPKLAGEVCRRDTEQWFFFSPMQESKGRGGKSNRLTSEGYWKATGSPGYVYSSDDHRIIGEKRTMVFYKGRACNGTKTEWKLNEYRAVVKFGGSSSSFVTETVTPKLQDELSLCRIYYTSKTLRAFDRRPNGAAISTQTTLEATASSSSSHQNHAIPQRTSFQLASNEENVFSQSTRTGNWNLQDISRLLLDD